MESRKRKESEMRGCRGKQTLGREGKSKGGRREEEGGEGG
jgi:hypothetical protein